LRDLILPLLIKKTEPLADDLMPGERREPTFSPLLLDGVDTEETRHGGRSSSSSSTMSTVTTPVRSALVSATDSELVDNLFAEVDDEEDDHPHQAPHCPRCDAPLVEREAKKGPHAGRLFMACSRFPECRYAAPHTNARH
jgi:hypothetical protein